VFGIYLFSTLVNLGEFKIQLYAIWQEVTRRSMATKQAPSLNLLKSRCCGMTAGIEKHHTGWPRL